jgi:transposase InsO family protein
MEEKRIRKRAGLVRRRQLHRRMNWRTAWNIVEQFVLKEMPAQKACEWLEISRSRLYVLKERWLKTWREGPQEGWLYQRPHTGQSRLPVEVRGFLEEELRYIRTEAAEPFRGHYNFAFLAQQCRQRFGKPLPRNTLRRWAIQQGFYDPQRDTTRKPYIRFETGGIGFLFQHDSSIHAWVPRTKRNDVLILTEDDHSRKIVGALLVPQDTAWHHLQVVRDTVETFGRPLAYYTDNHAIFAPNGEGHTQFSRALKSLDITLKLTAKASPTAKGKIEKRFDYLQRRIPYLCERYQITNLTKANQVLRDEVAFYNQKHPHAETGEIPEKRWNKALEEGRAYLQDLPDKIPLDIIFALHYPRVVDKTGSIEFAGRHWRIPKDPPIRQTVTVVLRPPSSIRRPHTEIYVLYTGTTLAHFVIPKKGEPQTHGPHSSEPTAQ